MSDRTEETNFWLEGIQNLQAGAIKSITEYTIDKINNLPFSTMQTYDVGLGISVSIIRSIIETEDDEDLKELLKQKARVMLEFAIEGTLPDESTTTKTEK